MKRILSLIFCCVFITLLIPQNIISAENESVTDVNCVEYDVIKQLGILPKEVINKAETGENVTRAEFAAVLYNILGFNGKDGTAAWSGGITTEEFFGEMYIEAKAAEETSNASAIGKFDDITSNTLFFDEINYVTSNGYLMSNEHSFGPDNAVMYVDCLETVLKLLGAGGYINAMGGYPEGVMKYGLTKRLYTKSAADRMSVIDVCKLLYTALDKNVIEGTIDLGRFSYKESETLFMEKVLGLTEYTGILTNDGFKSLTGDETQKNRITIGDNTFDCYFNCEEFFGMYIKAYVSVEERTEYTVFAIEESKKNTVTQINAKDFSNYNNYRIYYCIGNKEKSVKLSDKTILVYNGKVKDSWNKNDFDFADGTIKVIDNGSDYDVVVVENYKSVFVAGYDSANKIIYNKARDGIDNNGDEAYNLERAYDNDKLIITNKDGTKAGLGNIAQGMVIDIILNDDYAKLILNNEVRKGFVVTSVNKSSNYNHYFTVSSGNETVYVLNSILSCDNVCDILIGSRYTFYLNRNGDVAWITSELQNNSSIGYCMKVYTDDEDKVFVKLLTDLGVILKYPVNEKLSFVDENGNKSKIMAEAVSVRMEGYNGLISYEADSNNELKYIELAQKQRNNDEKLKLLYDSNGTKIAYQTHYSTGLTTFQNRFYLTDNTKVFVVPDDEESKKVDSNYKIGAKSEFSANASYDVTGYNFKANSRIAQYVVCRKKVETKFMYNDASLGTFVLVEDIYTGLNADDEPCRIVKGKMFGYARSVKEVEYYAKIDKKDSRGNAVSEFDVATDMVKSVDETGSYNTYSIQKGDIIRVVTEQDDKTVIMAQVVYSSAMKNPEFPKGRTGWLVGTRSNLKNGDDNYTNPFAVDYEDNDKLLPCGRWTARCKLLYGFVYNLDGDVMEITTKDLSVDSNYVRLSDEYITEWRRVNPSYTFTITKSGKNYSVTKGSSSDVKSFKDAGASCSKVIMCSINMNERATIIIND